MENVKKTDLKVDQKILSIGSDENCFDCVSACYVHSIEGDKVTIRDRSKPVGFLILMDFDDLNGEGINGFFADTKENKKALLYHCAQQRAKFNKSVDDQIKRAIEANPDIRTNIDALKAIVSA